MKILLGNHKGGVGKTFLATHIFFELGMQYKKPVLLVDEDPQRNCSKWIYKPDSTLKYLFFDTINGKFGLHATDDTKIEQMRKWLFVVIDTPPNKDLLANAIYKWKPNIVVIPTIARLSRLGVVDTVTILQGLNVKAEVVIVANNIRHSGIGYDILHNLRDFVKQAPKKISLYPDFIRHSGWVLRSEEDGNAISYIQRRGGRGRGDLQGQLRLLLNYILGKYE
jgi:cellulose biosynthesis protein BcsQ